MTASLNLRYKPAHKQPTPQLPSRSADEFRLPNRTQVFPSFPPPSARPASRCQESRVEEPKTPHLATHTFCTHFLYQLCQIYPALAAYPTIPLPGQLQYL